MKRFQTQISLMSLYLKLIPLPYREWSVRKLFTILLSFLMRLYLIIAVIVEVLIDSAVGLTNYHIL